MAVEITKDNILVWIDGFSEGVQSILKRIKDRVDDETESQEEDNQEEDL